MMHQELIGKINKDLKKGHQCPRIGMGKCSKCDGVSFRHLVTVQGEYTKWQCIACGDIHYQSHYGKSPGADVTEAMSLLEWCQKFHNK